MIIVPSLYSCFLLIIFILMCIFYPRLLIRAIFIPSTLSVIIIYNCVLFYMAERQQYYYELVRTLYIIITTLPMIITYNCVYSI